jgi:hypothetical protein
MMSFENLMPTWSGMLWLTLGSHLCNLGSTLGSRLCFSDSECHFENLMPTWIGGYGKAFTAATMKRKATRAWIIMGR